MKLLRKWIRFILRWIPPFRPVPRWRELHPVGSPPARRWQQTAVYHDPSNRMIVFAGKTNEDRIVDGVLTSGELAELNFDDVWLLENADGHAGPSTWTPLTTAGPTPPGRHMHTAVYDATNNRVIIFGGHVGPPFGHVFENDVWVLQNANGLGGTPTWSKLAPAGTPPPVREWHSAIYDAANNRMVVFSGTVLDDEVWVLEHASGLGGTPAWSRLVVTGPAPVGRRGHSAVYDEANNRMIVFGGRITGGLYPGDVWVLRNANWLGGTPEWLQLSPTGPPPPAREDHRAVYNAAENKMLVFAGWRASPTDQYFQDVWVLAHANGLGGTPVWRELTPAGTAPAKRELHSAVYNSGSDRMIAFGGSVSPTSMLNDVWILLNATSE